MKKRRSPFFLKRRVRNQFNWNAIRQGFFSPPTSRRLQVFQALPTQHSSPDLFHVLLLLLSSIILCVGAAVNQLASVSPVALTSPNVGRENATNEDVPRPGPVPHRLWKHRVNKLTHCRWKAQNRLSLIHAESALQMICPATAHYGMLRTSKHVKISSSADAGLLPADLGTNSISNLEKDERMRV